MMFHTVVFILGFLPACLAGFFAIGRFCGTIWALRWLVTSSLLFYGWWNPEHVPLLVGSLLLNHTIARKLRQVTRPQPLLAVGIGFNLAVLGWFKYADFLLHIAAPGAPALTITLPLAISFFTFQQIMFLVDTARDARSASVLPSHSAAPAAVGLMPGSAEPVLLDAADNAMPNPVRNGPFSRIMAGRTRVGPTTHAFVQARNARQGCQDGHDIKPIAAASGLLPYAVFVTFFPHLIAGPIVRASEIIPQLTTPGLIRFRGGNLADGLLIFLLGLAKKLVLADMFGGFADVGFDAAANGASLTFFEAWYATLSYALQIYFDFSGYSDMAIGLARMFNIRFPLNFDSPYQATSIADFWRRWHITLSSFLRDYLYIPLGGNRAGAIRQAGNLMATMLLAGLWHGAAWNFVLWGGLHGLFLVLHLQYRRLFRPMPAIIGAALTLFAVVVAWVPFRAASPLATVAMLGGMAGLNGITLPRMIVAAFPALAAIARPVAVMPFLGDARTLSFPEVSACLALGWLIVLTLPNVHRMTIQTRNWALTASFALSAQALFFAPHVAPFLYFQF